MKIVSGERIILSSTDDRLNLTNYRVSFQSTGIFDKQNVSIPLDSISFCGMSSRKNPIFILLALIFFFGLFAGEPEKLNIYMLFIGAALPISFTVAYFRILSGRILISSHSGESISVPTNGISHEKIEDFTNAIILARLSHTGKA